MASTGKCISCGAGLNIGGKKRVVCPYCGTTNIFDATPPPLGTVVCPQCGEYNPTDSEHCSQCGADLYFTCPRCGMRNSGDAVHCRKCGVHLSSELQKWRLEQAARQARVAQVQQKEKKRRKLWFIPVGILLFFGLCMTITLSIGHDRQNERIAVLNATSTYSAGVQMTAAAATAQVEYDTYPFVWKSDDGLLELRFKPRMRSVDGAITIYTDVLNRTGNRCAISPNASYAVDDQGRTYANSAASHTDYVKYVESDQKIDLHANLEPQLKSDAKTLTILYPKICGYSNIRITVDLGSSLLEFW